MQDTQDVKPTEEVLQPQRREDLKSTGELRMEHRSDGQLWISDNGTDVMVQVQRCFPWSEPGKFISLRDEDGKEIALIEDISTLDRASLTAVERALAEVGFVMEIEKVLTLEEDFEIRNWEVQTRQGMRKLQTNLDDWPQEVPGGGLVIREVSGDLFFIADPAKLDERSRKLLWGFLD